MDHLGDWMLPGVALALVVIVGIIMAALDDIVLALLHPRRNKGAEPLDAAIKDKAVQKPRRGRLTGHPRQLWRRTRISRSLTKIAPQ
jgi:hypothetical protein